MVSSAASRSLPSMLVMAVMSPIDSVCLGAAVGTCSVDDALLRVVDSSDGSEAIVPFRTSDWRRGEMRCDGGSELDRFTDELGSPRGGEGGAVVLTRACASSSTASNPTRFCRIVSMACWMGWYENRPRRAISCCEESSHDCSSAAVGPLGLVLYV